MEHYLIYMTSGGRLIADQLVNPYDKQFISCLIDGTPKEIHKSDIDIAIHYKNHEPIGIAAQRDFIYYEKEKANV